MARQGSRKPVNSSFSLGFEAVALRGSTFLQSKDSPQIVSEAKEGFLRDDEVRWSFGTPPWTNVRIPHDHEI